MSYVNLKFVHYLFLHHLLSAENEWAFVYIFLATVIVCNLFDNPILFKNVENIFLIDIMTHWWYHGTVIIKINQEVEDNFHVYVLNLLTEVSSMPSLVTINLVRRAIQIFQIVTWSHVGHTMKGPCGFKSRSFSR